MRTPAAGTCTGPGRRASRSVLSHHRFELRNPARVDASPTIGAVLQVLGSLQELSHVFEAQLSPRSPEETDLVRNVIVDNHGLDFLHRPNRRRKLRQHPTHQVSQTARSYSAILGSFSASALRSLSSSSGL